MLSNDLLTQSQSYAQVNKCPENTIIRLYTFTNGHQEHPPRGQDTGSSARAPPRQTCKRCLTMLMNNTWRRCGKATFLSIVQH